MPYHDKFIGWIIASEIDSNTLAEPFYRIRLGILSIAAFALFFSILLMMFGSKRIANPLSDLAKNIKDFAEGDHDKRLTTSQPIDEISTLATEFNYLADTLQKTEEERDSAQQMMLQNDKLVSIGEMAAGFGHEINNPLNNILAYSKLIKMALTQDNIDAATLQQTREDLAALRDESIRASNIVAGILNFARQVPLQYGKFDVCNWLEKTIHLVQQSARAKMLSLEIHCEFTGEIDGDQNQLQQALINLLLNAIYVSKAHDTITINCRKVEQMFEIIVQDQGPGIDPNHLNKIYDPFFTTKPEGVGTGLGLSISHGIIQRHNGKLELTNRATGGVTAILLIPLSRKIT
jgi:two-component system NtrC family sensor kinase